MATSRKRDNSSEAKRPPAKTPEARENQLMALATDLAEKQIREGTASAQVITHYLKLATTTSRLEQEKLIEEVKLKRAQTEAMASSARVEELYSSAIEAMREYAGQQPGDS